MTISYLFMQGFTSDINYDSYSYQPPATQHGTSKVMLNGERIRDHRNYPLFWTMAGDTVSSPGMERGQWNHHLNCNCKTTAASCRVACHHVYHEHTSFVGSHSAGNWSSSAFQIIEVVTVESYPAIGHAANHGNHQHLIPAAFHRSKPGWTKRTEPSWAALRWVSFRVILSTLISQEATVFQSSRLH